MEAQVMEAQRAVSRRSYFSQIRWSAILAGVTVGIGTNILLALLGVAIGLTAIDPQSTEPVGSIPIGAGIWGAITMLIAAFVGGYVAARMSGLCRIGDGLLHGFVSWGSTTVLFAFLTTTAVGSLLGGAFNVIGKSLQGAGQVAATAAQNDSNSATASGNGLMDQLREMVTGNPSGGDVSPEAMTALQSALQANDRQRAVDVMVNQMGVAPDRANQMADQASAIFGPQGEQKVRNAADTAVDALSTASWWLFFGLLLSLGLGVWGGVMGVRATSSRVAGHPSQRSMGTYPTA